MTSIYLDNNATTRLDPTVADRMAEVMQMRLANPASQHQEGARARRFLEECRLSILQGLGAETAGMSADRLLFTSGGTESNNLALFGLAQPGTRVLISAVEHPSVTAAAQHLAAGNFDVRAIPVDSDGVILLEQLERLLREAPTSLVCLMAANNETGVIQPIETAARLAHQHGARIHCDAVQWVGKQPTFFRQWGVDSLSASCHKFHGPVGIGVLCLRHGVPLSPMFYGGFQQDGLRPGTENVVLAAGFQTALELALGFDYQTVQRMRDRLEKALLLLNPAVRIHGQQVDRMPHTLNVAFVGANRQAFLLAADMQGLRLSVGSACASGSSEPSPVLIAMGLDKALWDSSLRISLGRDTAEGEIEQTIAKIGKIYASLQKP